MSGSADVKKSFIGALKNSDRKDIPYRHWLLNDIFSDNHIDDLLALPIAVPQMDYSSGQRQGNNDKRGYFDAARQREFPICGKIAGALQSPETIRAIEDLCEIDLGGTYLRIEYTQDGPGFWLEPHTDIRVKKFTMLVHLSRDEDAHLWGTTIYKDANTVWGMSNANTNHGTIFIPADDTWHGYEKRPMSGIRKSLIINYVTDQWRAREELAFADTPVNSVR